MPIPIPNKPEDCGHKKYRMLIKPSSEFCDLLFREYNPENKLITNSKGDFKCSKNKVLKYLQSSCYTSNGNWLKKLICAIFCDKPSKKETLVGYILKPHYVNGLIPTKDKNSNIACIKIYPVWLLEDQNGFEEVLENGIELTLSLIHI